MKRRSNIECETSITWNLEEPEAILWTCQPVMLRKMAKLGIEAFRNDGEGKAYKVPKNWVCVRKPKIMNLSPEQKALISARAKANIHAFGRNVDP